MWNKLTSWLNEKESAPLDNHNESTRTWSKGYRKAFHETNEFVSEIKPNKPKRSYKPLIIGVLSILSLFAAFLILYARTTEKVDINSCSAEALIALPDIGPVLAQRIIDGRPYRDLEELDRVKGIGPETIKAIRYKVSVKEM